MGRQHHEAQRRIESCRTIHHVFPLNYLVSLEPILATSAERNITELAGDTRYRSSFGRGAGELV